METNKRYINLSLFRIIAAFAIIQFHIFYILYPNMVDGAYLLSKFLQGFMTLSGFLYSQRVIENKKEFYKKNFKKILIPAIACATFILLWDVGYILITKTFDFTLVFTSCKPSDGGLLIQLGNYYYIFYLLFCYLITPFLQFNNNLRKIIIISIISIEVIASFITNGFPVLITCYIVGYFIGKNRFDFYVNPKSGEGIETLIKWIFIGFLAYYFSRHPLIIATRNAFLDAHLSLMIFNVSSAIFGMSIFFIIIYILRGLNAYRSGKSFLISDGLTFYIYLLNQAFMIGATNVSNYADAMELKTLLVFLFTIFFATIIYVINAIFLKKCSLKNNEQKLLCK